MEELGIGAKEHHPHLQPATVEPQLREDVKRQVAGPVTVGHQHRRRAQQRTGDDPLVDHAVQAVAEEEQLAPVQDRAVGYAAPPVQPPRRVGGRLEVAAPDELRTSGAGQGLGRASP
jgi:hypothetical protein